MANPQKENGYAAIANEILEAVSKCKFNGTQFRILTVVWRYTYGFSRKDHELSVSFIVDATGITKRQIQKELNNLMDDNVLIEVRQASFNTTRIIAFNKNYEEWKLYTCTPKTAQVNKECRGEQKDTSPGEQKDTSPGERLDTQESNNKTILKQEEEKPKNPVQLYEENFGMMSTMQMQKIWSWVDDFRNQEVIKIAIEETALKNPRSHFSYFESILKDWYKRKLFTVDDVLKEKEKFEKSKQANIGTHTKQNKVDWEALANE